MTDCTSTPQLIIDPPAPLADEVVSIRLTSLSASEQILLRARMVDDTGAEWPSEAMFLSEADGSLDVGSKAPLSGSYTTVDPMGLIWSMRSAPSPEGSPLFAKSGLEPTRITVEALENGDVVASAEIVQRAVADDVEWVPVRDRGLRGTLFLPPGSSPYPGVIVIGGSGGGLQEGRAALLASRGFATMALAYFAFEDLPEYLVDIPLEYFETAIDWMLERSDIDGRGVALIGSSRGGEGVLLLGSLFQKVCAVAAFVPSHVVWQGFGGPEGASPCYAWTYQDKGIEPMPGFEPEDDVAAVYAQSPIPLTPLFEISLRDTAAVERAAILVERINGPVLLVSGKEDAMWPSSAMADRVVARLREKGFPHEVQHLAYENAGHLILPPYRPTTVSAAKHPVDGQVYTFGGTPVGGAFANADSWSRTIEFLREAFS